VENTEWEDGIELFLKEKYNSIPEDAKEIINRNIDSIVELLYNDDDEIIMIESMDNIENKIQELNVENVDNSTLANIVAEKVGYEFARHILIKPLDVQKVYKTLTVPEDSGEKSEDGEPIMQMTIKEIETESILRTGVVISTPSTMKANENKIAGLEIKTGDVIVFPKTRMMDFDLFKDTALVEPFDVIGIVA